MTRTTAKSPVGGISVDHYYVEYSECSGYVRHYSSIRFAIFTVYFAVIGGVGAVALGITPATRHVPASSFAAAVCGAIVTVAFFVLEVTCEHYLEHFRARLVELDWLLGYHTMRARPQDRSHVKSATWTLYAVAYLMWIALIMNSQSSFLQAIIIKLLNR